MSFAIEDRATGLAVIEVMHRRAAAAGIALDEPPAEPEGCCGTGCVGCVWEGWYEAVAWWRDEAEVRLGG